MYYDEQLKRREQRLAQILSIPISDFQLSVRSRACLEKLGVRSLGDMTKWTEPGLLKTENFGMTSLAEIKELLARHGLTLSQEEFTLPESTQPAVSSTQSTTDLLNKPLSEFEWSARTKGCMARMKLYIVGDLTKHTEAELLAVQNFGQTSLTEVKQRLNLLGLVLKLPE
ncbi:MAG: RNA polymerase subunit alpha domain protein, partial [Planctomycetes bacterium]|nr:RNA polymerase subunit alpha domain protein [Planctomycetota bacterium]